MASRITWTDDEWQSVAIALMRNPKYQGGLPEIIGLTDLREAISTLPQHRRRPVYTTTTNFRTGLTIAIGRIREVLKSGSEELPEPPAPAPVEELQQAPVAKESRIFWKPEEYVALARQLHRASPSANYHLSNTLAGLTAQEVREAERIALPSDRRRRLNHLGPVRERLVEAFKTIRDELDEQKQPPLPQRPAAPAQPEAKAAVDTQPPQIIEEPPQRAPVQAPPAAQEHAETNPHEIALRVLVEMLVPELAKQLGSALAKQIGLAPMMPQPAAAPIPEPMHMPTDDDEAQPAALAVETATTRLTPEQEAALENGPPADWTPPEYTRVATPAPPTAPKNPVIGVIGLKPVHVRELEEAFPLVDFELVEGGHSTKTLKKLQSALRVISANTTVNGMGQMTDKMLAKHLGDRYIRVPGGMSMVKRQLQMWVHAGILKSEK